MKILVLNGPNMNLLGIRELDIYGTKSYNDLVQFIEEEANKLHLAVDVRQTNHEGVLVDWIQEAYGKVDGIILNAAAYTHTSVAILDALRAVSIPTVEVHMTDTQKREEFRHISYVAMASECTFSGEGFESYRKALTYFANR